MVMFNVTALGRCRTWKTEALSYLIIFFRLWDPESHLSLPILTKRNYKGAGSSTESRNRFTKKNENKLFPSFFVLNII